MWHSAHTQGELSPPGRRLASPSQPAVSWQHRVPGPFQPPHPTGSHSFSRKASHLLYYLNPAHRPSPTRLSMPHTQHRPAGDLIPGCLYSTGPARSPTLSVPASVQHSSARARVAVATSSLGSPACFPPAHPVCSHTTAEVSDQAARLPKLSRVFESVSPGLLVKPHHTVAPPPWLSKFTSHHPYHPLMAY